MTKHARLSRRIIAIVAAMSLNGALAAAPPSGGTIAIQPKTADGSHDPAMAAFVDAVSEALTADGFVILDDPAHAAYSAELTLGHAAVGTALGKASKDASAGIGNWGVVLPLPAGKSSVVSLQRTQLEIRIHKRGSDETIWKGAALTVRETGTRRAADPMVASDLSKALLGSYPAEPSEVVGVP